MLRLIRERGDFGFVGSWIVWVEGGKGKGKGSEGWMDKSRYI